jgi:hypothetical protein
MQLLELVVFDIGIEICTAHGVGIVLVRNWAVLTRARVPRRDHTFLRDASVVRGWTIVVRVISGKAPATNLP